MPRVFYSAFDVVPSPKGASTHITHFVRGLTEAGYAVHLLTPGDVGVAVFKGDTVLDEARTVLLLRLLDLALGARAAGAHPGGPRGARVAGAGTRPARASAPLGR